MLADGEADFLYSPVPFSGLFSQAAETNGRRLLLGWVLILLASIGLAILTKNYNWYGIPIDLGGVQTHLAIFTPTIIGSLLTFWFGAWWGIGPTFTGTLAVSLSSGIPLPWALGLATATSLGLIVIALAYRSTPIPLDQRSIRAVAFFLFVSYFAALVGSSAAFLWASSHHLAASETFRLWQGWWLRSFLQSLVITLPVMWAVGRPVMRWKKRLGLHRSWTTPDTNDIGIVFGLMLFVLSMFILGASYLARLNLKTTLTGIRDRALVELLSSATESLTLIDWVSFGFIIFTGYFGYQLALNWTQALRQQIELQMRSLRESEERYRMLFEINPQPMYVYDRQTLEFLAVNQAMVEGYGYSREELLGLTMRDIRPPEDLQPLLDSIANAQMGMNIGGQWLHRKKDGTHLNVEVVYHPLDFDGRPAMLAQATDVSDRKRTEDKIRKLNDYLENSVKERTAQLAAANVELRREIGDRRRAEDILLQTNQTLETLIESSPLAILTFDANEKVTRWNQAAEQMFGWSAPEVIGQGLPMIPPDPGERADQLREAVRQGASFTGLELTSRRKDRAEIKVSLSVAPLPDASSSIAIISDITQRKLMEEEIRQSEERYRSLFDGTPLPVWVYDRETLEFLMVNDAAINHYGYAREEFAAMTIADLRPPEHLSKFLDSVAAPLPPVLKSGNWRHRKKDGRIIDVELTAHEVSFSGRAARLVVANDITELKRALEALRSTNQTLETLIQSSPLTIIMLDREGCVQVWNTAAERTFGWAEAELIGHPLPFGDEAGSDDFRTLQEVVLQGVPFSVMDFRTRKRDALPIDISLSAAPVRDAAGKINGIMAVINDITDHKRAEEKLRESEERYRDLFENANDLIQSVAPDGRLLYVNRAWLQTLGYGEEAVAGLTMMDIIDPAHQEHCSEALQSVMSGDEVGHIETLFVTRDGRRITVEGSINCKFENGRPVSTRGMFRDITSRKQAEEGLRNSEARIRAIIENSLTGLVLTDQRGLIQLANPAAERIFGYSRDELMGQHLAMLLPEAVGEDKVSFLKRAREKALGRVTEWQCLRRNGEIFPVELSFYEFDTPEGRRLAGNLRDLSERHEVDRLKKEFISTVSHELRTPLTSIRGSLSLLTSGIFGALPPEAADMLRVADRNTVRLISLINDILDLERLETGKMEMHFEMQPLAPVLQRAFESVGSFARQQSLSVNVLPTEATVLADSDRLVQVLVNLLSNAVKFSPAGSEITISASAQKGWVEVRVQDQGRGIPAKFLDKIFERFRQVEASDDRQKGGTGLGLAICKNIIEQHRGTIGVSSEEGKGSTFWFRIPAVAAQVTDPQASQQASGARRLELSPAENALTISHDKASS